MSATQRVIEKLIVAQLFSDLLNSTFHFPVHKIPLLDSGQFNPVHTFTPYFS